MALQPQIAGGPLVSPAQSTRPLAAPDGPCDRRYVDTDGVAWCVHERTFDDHPPALYFESIGAVRRVRQYPAGWRSLTATELDVLSYTK